MDPFGRGNRSQQPPQCHSGGRMPTVNTVFGKPKSVARDLEMEEEEGGQFPNPFRFCCYREMELLEFREKLVFRSQDHHDSSTTRPAFSISRSDGVIESCNGDFESETPTKCSIIYGIVGTIRLLSGTFVLVITSRKEVSNHLGFPIFLVKSMEFLSCNSALVNSTKQENSDEAYFMNLLKIIETTPALYYSYEIDLTLNLQRSWEHAKQRATRPLWKQADPRFIWNRNLLEELIECKLDPFIVPLIQGSVQSMQVMLKNSPLKISLISRRCNRRLGTRMWRRGANLDGDTANFIETEQLVEFEDFRTAFLQVRGSIPLLWEQIVDLSYKPQLNILNHEETPKVIERHFNDLKQRYGEVVAVDLTDNHGEEGQLSRRFALEMKKVLNVRYISFNFHQFCGNANLDNLQPLCDQISEDIEMHGYFMLNLKGDILLEQKGVIRTNCIDCLDRTNVTQCYVGRKSLDAQLKEMGVFSSSDYISMYPEINEDFKILWIDHGDDISLGYSGTHALKRDFVRFGRQTLSGFIKDGMSAISRYYLNNFQDGTRQDALDLISGHYCIDRGAPSPFQLNGLGSFSYLPTPSAVIVGGLTLTTLAINQSAGTARHFYSSMLCAGLAASVIALVNANGRQLCSRPRLCNLL